MTKHTRIYDDLEAFQQHESVTKWLQGLTEQDDRPSEYVVRTTGVELG